MSEQLIDQQAIKNILELGDNDQSFVTEIINAYILEADETMLLISDTLKQKEIDYYAISRYAHKLKSSSANIGATILHSMFKWLELTCRGFHEGEYQVDDQLIHNEFAKTCMLFSQTKELLLSKELLT
jgi:HPt (histidine-containing phosphotransfer) domain-containing protein